MKRSSILCQIALLGLVGCAPQADPAAATSTPPTSTEATVATEQSADAVTFVSLKVPNMH